MLVSGLILALYFWAYVTPVPSINGSLLVSDMAAIVAGVAMLSSFISYLWAPQQYAFWGSFISYIALCGLAAILILDTGGVSSPFIALWMLVSVFAGVFGWYGLVPLLVASLGYMALQSSQGLLSRDAIVTIALMAELPLIASYLIWHREKPGEGSGEKAYRRLATELSQVANKSEVVINAIADGVVALNSQGIIQLINPAAQQIIGWGKQDALTLDYKSVLQLLDKNGHDIEPSGDPIAQVLATNKQVVSSDLGLKTNSDKKLLISISVSPVGQLGSGVIVVFRDITSEKAEEREQAEFISTASHEMRTPVATIEGYLGLALNPATAQIDDKARDFITKAHESAQHLGRLFADLLDISKSEDGRLQSNPKAVDVVAFTNDITNGLRPQADNKGLRIVFKPLPDGDEKTLNERRLNPVYYANVDNDHLREVFGNLVENAIKYTLKGDIAIDVTGDNDHVVISVADSGIGIPKEDQVHLFQKFYRVDNTDTREIGGTGLGLYLSRRLAETMGGRIWVESEYRQGSTFFLELPRMSHEEAMRSIEMIDEPPATPEIVPHPQQVVIEQAPQYQQEPEVSTTASPPTYQLQPQMAAPAPAVAPMPTPAAPATARVVRANPLPNGTTPYQQRTPTAAAPPPTYSPMEPPQFPNTPLTHIEQNPHQYIRQPNDGPAIPPRQ